MIRDIENYLPNRLLDAGARLTHWTLMVITPLVLLLGVLVVAGVGSVNLAGSTETVRPLQLDLGEYQIQRPDGRLVDVAETTRFESDDGEVTYSTTKVEIAVGKDETTIRAVAVALVVGWLALTWVGVINLGAIAKSIRAGDGFTTPNARRLRRVGVVVLAYPLLTLLGRLVLRRLVDSLDLAGPAVSVDVGVADWWAWLLLGLLILALAELFAQGVKLQDLDEATV